MHYQHRLPHEVTIIEGERFPSCKKCGNRVKFSLVAAPKNLSQVTPIIADRDFDLGFQKELPA